jgi:NADH-quinone oxidoreductase subunit N
LAGSNLADSYGSFFKILFLLAALLVILSAGKYIERFRERSSEFYALMIFATLGMMIMACAGDLITVIWVGTDDRQLLYPDRLSAE